MSRPDAILERLLKLHPKLIDLDLARIAALLEAMGRPQDRLPPVIHVAGTNGKGSTIAYLRAFLEAAGKRVHVYTSPHLVRFNERIRLAGRLVEDEALAAALEACETANAGRPITFFEITTAAAFKLFAEVEADYLLLEVGLGGEFDATNVIDHPLAAVITPVDIDHVQFLGRDVGNIAVAKAGILKRGASAVLGRQRPEGLATIERRARALGITPFVAGTDFDGHVQHGRLVYQDEAGLLDLPLPRLAGPHQVDNAALAIAVCRHAGLPVEEADIAKGLRSVDWPARLSAMTGPLRDRLGRDHELWLDGGHNAHGSAALARALAEMNERAQRPLVLIVGMMNTRPPEDFFAAFAGLRPSVLTLAIPGEANAWPPEQVAAGALENRLEARPAPSLAAALDAAATVAGARVVICGSLYLAGHVLAENGTLPA